ncbi:MAG TPA: MBG domain-containing protein [Opitutaceae bacterium]|nr:MBG domain-containing protein [Opitutaceae bacterium]
MNPQLPPPARSRRTSTTSLSKLALSLVVLGPLAVLPPGYALPTGGQVIAGSASVSQAGARMTINQTSRNAIMNWQSFSVGAGEQLRLNQSGANAAMLARVTGADPSALLGSLKADGKLFLINPRGILVGQGAVIDTAAFIGSTLDVSNQAFLAGGAMTFQGDSTAGIANYGQITAREGNVMLFAHTVKNAGALTAPKGAASLAAANEVYLANPDDTSIVIKFNVPSSTAKSAKGSAVGVENSGVIRAAQAELQAAGGSMYDLAVNQTGIIRATGVERKNGRILLTADGGTVGVGGSVTARNADGSGGEILVGGDAHGANPNVPNAAHTVVTADAKLDASASAPNAAAGRVIVWSDEATRFLGTIDAQGSGGGFAEVSGRHSLEFNPSSPVNLGRDGTLLLDPDALVISTSADSGTTTAGTNPFTFGASTTSATLNVTTLENQLATSNVVLDTSSSAGDITFNAPVTWGGNTLTAKAGGSININANLTGGANSALVLNPGKAAMPTQQGLTPINPKATLAAGSTITVGTLTYGSNASAAPAGYNIVGGTVAADFEGNLKIGSLQVDLSAGGTGVLTNGGNNTIGEFRTTGMGDLTSAQVANDNGAMSVYLNTTNSSAPQIRITTPGLLTLEFGSSLSFASQTDVILASTGSGFTNQAGANVFGSNARFLIYDTALGATTKDGLAGIDVYSHPYNAADSFSSDTASRFLYQTASGLPFLTYTADNLSRTYGAADPTFTATVTGYIGGLTNDVTGLPTFSTTATQSSGVGTYTINVGRGTLASSNYDFTFAPGTLSITAAPLTITANDASRTPNTANPTFGVTYSGLVAGDTTSVVSGLTVGTTATLTSPVGTYAITPAGATAANYAITFAPGTLTISNNNPLTLTANDFNRTYGAANPTFTASMSGFVGTDTSAIVSGLQFNTTATQSSGVGTYAITPFGATAPGYVITYVPGTLLIAQAPLVITPNSTSRFYGDANPTFTASFSGLVAGDTPGAISGLNFATTATPGSNVGAYPITASGATNPNYSITYGAAGQLTINPAPLTVTFNNQTRVYGDPNPALTYTVSGLKNGDSAASSVSVTNVTMLAAVTDGIGAYGIDGLVLSQSSNYTTTTVGGDLTITPRPLTITADNKSKVYGDANPTLTATFSGLAPFDTAGVIPNLQLSTTATLTSGVSPLGYGILVSSGLNQNYAISYKFGTLTITPALLTTLAPPDLSRTYGRADPSLPTLAFGGLKNSDTLAGLGASYVNIPAPTADAGTYTYGIAISNPNYQLSGTTTASFRVDPAPLDVQISGAGRTYGDANPTSYTLTATGLAFGQTANSVLSVVNPTDPTTGVGTYSLQAQLNTHNYYIHSTTGGAFQINPRLLTFSIDNITKYYGDPIPDFTYTFGADGLAPSDNITAVISGFQTAVPVGLYTNVGLYRIDPIFKANPNYLVSWTPAYLAIVPRPITLTINNAIAFGNDDIPAGFSTVGTGIDLVHPTPGNAGAYTGFTITATNLPTNVSLKDIYPSLTFNVSSTNNPQPVVTAVDLNQLFPKTTATAPQATTADVSTSAAATGSLASSAVVLANIPATFDATVYAVINGQVVKNPSAAQQVLDRFKDQTLYVSPATYANANYAVTGITDGILTFKVDPAIVRINTEIALLKDERAAAQKQFANNGHTGAFGLPPDLFPVLRELLGKMLNDCLLKGDTGPGSLYYAVNGGPGMLFTGDQAQEDKFLFWLADIHTNVAKQALLLPGLLTYTMNVAGRDPKTWSSADRELVDFMTPYVQKAQEQFAAKISQEKQAWLKAQASAAGAATFMLGTGDMYSDVVSAAVLDVSKSATDKLSTEVTKMVNDANSTLDTTDPAYGQIQTTLKYSVDTALSGAGIAAGAAATKAYLADTGAFKGKRNDGLKGDIKKLYSNDKALDDALKKITSSVSEDAGDYSSYLRKVAGQSVEDTVAKVLQSDESQGRISAAYDDAYQKALAGGATEDAAKEAGADAAQTEVRTIAEQAGKEAIDGVAENLGKYAGALNAKLASTDVQDAAQKAYQSAYDETYRRTLAAAKTKWAQEGKIPTGSEVEDG